MKLVRHGASGDEKPGLVDRAGDLRDLSSVVRDVAGPALSPESLGRLRAIDPETLTRLPAGTRLGPCVGGTRNFIAIGLNFADHAAETGPPIPAEPILFNKAPNSLQSGPNDDVILPKGSAKTDWEVELAVVIGTTARYVDEKDAMVATSPASASATTSRSAASRSSAAANGSRASAAETFGPLGPWLVTPDEIADVQNLAMWLDVNGERMQTGSTKTMIFGVAQIVAYSRSSWCWSPAT